MEGRTLSGFTNEAPVTPTFTLTREELVSLRKTALRRYYLSGTFQDAGQRDEAYRLEGGRWGRWGLWGAFREIPHEYSWNGESPYFGVSDGDLQLPYDRPAPDMAAAFETALQTRDVGFQTLQAEGGGFLRVSR